MSRIAVTRAAVEVAKNFAMGIPVIRRWRVSAGRAARFPERAELHHQVSLLYDAVIAASGPLVGKSVLEIGPNDCISSCVTLRRPSRQ